VRCAGWDVFSLRYDVEEPLASVLTDAAAARLQVTATSACTTTKHSMGS
jgi:hypothetical protein